MSPRDSFTSATRPSCVRLQLEDHEPLRILEHVRHSLFVINHHLQSAFDLIQLQRVKAELGTSRLDGRDDLVHIVTYNAEPHISRVLFDNSAQCTLRCRRHSIGLIQNYQLEAALVAKDILCAGKALDLFPHNIDSAVVRGIQLDGCAVSNAGRFVFPPLTSNTLFLKLAP